MNILPNFAPNLYIFFAYNKYFFINLQKILHFYAE